MLTRDEIKDYFQLENSHDKKELGQNFLCNQKTIDEIVSLVDVQKDDVLLEIGPGLGALTNDLIGKTKNYTVVEYDAKFVDYLTRAYGDKDIKIVKNNILKYKEFDANKVVGNLPYYITSDILLYLALNYHKLVRAVLMMQREAYKRITAKQGTKDYNALNIVLDYCFKITWHSSHRCDPHTHACRAHKIIFAVFPKFQHSLSPYSLTVSSSVFLTA